MRHITDDEIKMATTPAKRYSFLQKSFGQVSAKNDYTISSEQLAALALASAEMGRLEEQLGINKPPANE